MRAGSPAAAEKGTVPSVPGRVRDPPSYPPAMDEDAASWKEAVQQAVTEVCAKIPVEMLRALSVCPAAPARALRDLSLPRSPTSSNERSKRG